MIDQTKGPRKKRTSKAKRRATALKKLRLVWVAERVFLAWIRTAIALMALGFLIARLGALLHLAGVQSDSAKVFPLEATIAGIVLMTLGGLVSAIATWRFRKAHRNIARGKIFRHSAHLSLIVGVVTALIALCLVISLFVVATRL